MAKNETPISRIVTVDTRAAAVIWNMGVKKWKRLFDRSLRDEVRHYKSEHDQRYVLIDLMAAAYPSADGRTLHSMCLEFTLHLGSERVEKYAGRKREGK